MPVPAQAAKDIVLSEKPVIMDDSANLDPLLLDKLLAQVRPSHWKSSAAPTVRGVEVEQLFVSLHAREEGKHALHDQITVLPH